MKPEYKTHLIFEKLDVEKNKTKIGRKVYDVMNGDVLGIVVKDGIFWFEISSHAKVPNYAYEYIKNFYIKLGYRYI